MAPVCMFGRQWRVSSDDFVFPALTELVIRVGWILVVVSIIVFHLLEAANLECLGAEHQLTTYYLAITLVLLILACCNCALIAIHSARGKITETRSNSHPRRWVEPLLYINIFLTLAEFIWTMIGTYFTIKDFIKCIDEFHERTVILAVLVIIGLTYILLSVKLLLLVISFRPFGGVEQEVGLLDGEEREKYSKQEADLNYRGLRCIAPCTNDEDAIQAFRDIANLLCQIFGDRDLVPSDVMAGLVLLNHKQWKDKERLSSVRHDGEMEVSKLVDISDVKMKVSANDSRIPLNWELLKHYYQFASAAYGYWWYIIESPVGQSCSLGSYLNCCPSLCCCRQKEEMFVEGDGVFRPNLAAIRAKLEVKEKDIIMFDNRNNLEEVPFFLVADRSTNSLVISIRGTLSLHDLLTDLRGEPGRMADESITDIEVDFHAHQGMVNAARYVYKRLHGIETGRTGERSSNKHSRKDMLRMALDTPDYSGYKLVVTGHSLGAGTASILAFLLRAKYGESMVTCYAYCPPGGLLSKDAAEESEKFTVGVVMRDDVIPRTSLNNIAMLSRDIKHVISQCELAKYKVLGYGCMACLCPTNKTLRRELDRMFLNSDSSVSSPGEDSNDGSSKDLVLTQESVTTPTAPVPFPCMYLPGRVLYVQDADSENTFSVTEVLRTVFSNILVSPRMLSDHLPNQLDTVFQTNPENLQITSTINI